MSFSAFYDLKQALSPEGEKQSLEVLDKAVENGVTLLNSATFYGADGHNESLIGQAVKKHGADKFVISTKFGVNFTANPMVNASRDVMRKECDESRARLGVDTIDVFVQARQDPNTPIEEVMKTLKELIDEKKIKYIGLSEITPDELRRAHKVHPVTLIEIEYSLMTRDCEKELIPTARELGIAILAYSPFSRGLLAHRFTKREDLAEGDWRLTMPRFNAENFDKNAAMAVEFAKLAEKKGCTPGQLALAWVHHQGDDVFPIPGTKNPKYLAENVAAAQIKLSKEELAEMEDVVSGGYGDRYAGMHLTWESRIGGAEQKH